MQKKYCTTILHIIRQLAHYSIITHTVLSACAYWLVPTNISVRFSHYLHNSNTHKIWQPFKLTSPVCSDKMINGQYEKKNIVRGTKYLEKKGATINILLNNPCLPAVLLTFKNSPKLVWMFGVYCERPGALRGHKHHWVLCQCIASISHGNFVDLAILLLMAVTKNH